MTARDTKKRTEAEILQGVIDRFGNLSPYSRSWLKWKIVKGYLKKKK